MASEGPSGFGCRPGQPGDRLPAVGQDYLFPVPNPFDELRNVLARLAYPRDTHALIVLHVAHSVNHEKPPDTFSRGDLLSLTAIENV